MYIANWPELIKSKTRMITDGKQDCGKTISKDENYIVKDGSINHHYYKGRY